MADLKKLAMGRKGIAKAAPKEEKKPAKSLEKSSSEEVGELESAFRDRLAKEDKRRQKATDSETWFCVYFPDRQAKDAFLRKYGLDKAGDKYLPGNTVDRILDRRINPARDGHRRK